MPTFEYTALAADGQKATGIVSADNARAARQELRMRRLTPLAVSEAGNVKDGSKKRSIKISNSDRILVTRQLAVMIGSGMQVEQALGHVSSQAEKQSVRQLLASLRNKVAEGFDLSEALADHPQSFPRLYKAVTAAGEVSGDVSGVLDRLADHMEKSQKTRRKVQTALIYPSVLGCVAVSVIILLMVFVVPRIVSQFDTFGQDLPWLTRTVIGLSEGLQAYGLFLLIAGGLAIIGWQRLLRQKHVRRRFDAGILKLPIIGKMTRIANGAGFARTFSMLVGSGTPVVESLTAARGSLGNLVFIEAIDEVIVAVREGVAPARALVRTGVFPPILASLIASGAASENLADLMGKGAHYLEEEFDRTTAIVLGLLEPLIILFLGTLVALIVLSIMLPIMELNTLAFG